MAILERREEYTHATIDISDLTLTEYMSDGARTYSIKDILERWDGTPDIEISIRQKTGLSEDKR